MNDEMRIMLEELAAQNTWLDDDDMDLYGMCGGNIEDSYGSGIQDGRVLLARELLKKF